MVKQIRKKNLVLRKLVWVGSFILLLLTVVSMHFAYLAYKQEDYWKMEYAGILATIFMAIVIALQAMLTAIGVEETRKQAELMNESLVEMRKQRLNIEEFKNSRISLE